MLDELQRADSSLVAMLDSLFDGIYVTDRKRNILFWNRGAEQITGYAREEVLGRSCRDDILNHIDEKGVLLCRNHCPLVTTLACLGLGLRPAEALVAGILNAAHAAGVVVAPGGLFIEQVGIVVVSHGSSNSTCPDSNCLSAARPRYRWLLIVPSGRSMIAAICCTVCSCW